MTTIEAPAVYGMGRWRLLSRDDYGSCELTRWCKWCGSATRDLGYHHANGDFDQWSVMVTDDEVDEAIARRRGQFQDTPGQRRMTHWNIAFGKHIGSYEPER